MALETLKGVRELGGFAVCELLDFADKRPEEFIVVNHKNNGINFKIQNGPIKENGVNGCQVDTLIHTARHIIGELNKKFPSTYNSEAIAALDVATEALDRRTKDREARGVEGKSEA